MQEQFDVEGFAVVYDAGDGSYPEIVTVIIDTENKCIVFSPKRAEVVDAEIIEAFTDPE